MKQWYVHLIYLSVIAYLGYNYWSSVQAFKAFEQLDRQLKMDYSVMDNSAERIHTEISKYYFAYKNERSAFHFRNSERTMQITNNIANFIGDNRKEFVKINGGSDTLNKVNLINENSSKTTNRFFTNAKITEIKGKLSEFSKILLDSIRDKTMVESCDLSQLIADDKYWELIKTLPTNGALAQLTFIRNQIKTDQIKCLNYHFREMQGDQGCFRFDKFKVVISPYKSGLIEGEAFEADVFLGVFSSNLGSNCKIKINGEFVEIQEGVAHFKSKNQTIGTKTIKAEAIIRNPLTGQTTTSEGSFEYQVLPKCSRDCQ
jgi:hypothetical protein